MADSGQVEEPKSKKDQKKKKGDADNTHEKSDPKKQDQKDKKQKVDGKVEKQGKGDRAPPKVDEGEGKSKAQLKAERRAKQEAQRAAKSSKLAEGPGAKTQSGTQQQNKKESPADKSVPKTPATANTDKKVSKKTSSKKDAEKLTEAQLWAKKEKNLMVRHARMDAAVVTLGCQYFHQTLVGANARCLAMLNVFRELIGKYKTPPGEELPRDLAKNYLAPVITYLAECRPISTSMGNAIKHIKLCIQQVPPDTPDHKAISQLQEEIDSFIHVNLRKAAEAVAGYVDRKISNGDVILVYAASSLIANVLKTAHQNGKKFRVIVVDGRPRMEGKSMLRFLVHSGIPCSYTLISSASQAMKEATKVLLGAAAMFAIGDMHARSGSSMVAALARAHGVPVLACCETYKFTDRVQLQAQDSHLHAVTLTSPARGSDLLRPGRQDLADLPHLTLLNLSYDVTPSRHITSLVTELGTLPCTSVPVVLRRQEDLATQGY